jgi:N-methylhydantoinase B/oxoprolinase/acetone carboxylase alpha subunit
MAKIAKSVRIDPKVYEHIEKYKGEGFNEKFENIILDAMESEKKRLDRIKQLDKSIREQEEKHQKLLNDIRKLSDVSFKVNNIIRNITEVEKQLAG